MIKQLNVAEADLAAVGQLSNGGPPLDAPSSSSPTLTLNQATNVVAEASK